MATVVTVKTSTFTVDDSGNPEPITCTIACRKIRVSPQDGASSYWFRAPGSSNAAVKKFTGETTIIERPSPGQYQQGSYGDPGLYQIGDVVGYLETVSGLGAKTFQMEEML